MNYYYSNHQGKYINRAERRKNHIRNEKIAPCQYSKEEMRDYFGNYLKELKNESYSETLRKEGYRRLKQHMEEYEKQSKGSNISKQKSYTQRKPVDHKTQRAISAYEAQMAYSRLTATEKKKMMEVISPQSKVLSTNKKEKKGFFTKVLEFLGMSKKNRTTYANAKRNISGVKNNISPARCYQNTKKKMQQVTKKVWNEFEENLRNMDNYMKENPNCKFYINGREVNFDGMCL